MRSYDVILFDCGATLLEFRPGERTRAWAEIVGRAPEVVDVAWRVARSGTPQLRGFETAGEYEAWRAEVCSRTVDSVGFEGDRSAATAAMSEAWIRVGWEPFADAIPVLSELHVAGYRLGVVSNWTATLGSTLGHVGLSEYFETVACSALIGAMKPDPRIFRHALATLGCEAANALYVGDNYEADVLGARGAGLDAVLLVRDGARESEDDAATTTIRSLLELPGILEAGGPGSS